MNRQECRIESSALFLIVVIFELISKTISTIRSVTEHSKLDVDLFRYLHTDNKEPVMGSFVNKLAV